MLWLILLLDMIIYPDGRYHLIDVDELATAIEKGDREKDSRYIRYVRYIR